MSTTESGLAIPEITIPRLLMTRSRELGDRTALRVKELGLWRDISWEHYAKKVRQTALGLIALGLEPGDSVAVIGENRPEWLYADIGTMAAGGVTVGIYTTSSAEECGYILKHSEAKIYVVEDEEQLDKALEVRGQCPNLGKIVVIDTEGLRNFHDDMVLNFDELCKLGKEHDRLNPNLFEERLETRRPDDLALLIYTSGTTGPPKGPCSIMSILSGHCVHWLKACLSWKPTNWFHFFP